MVPGSILAPYVPQLKAAKKGRRMKKKAEVVQRIWNGCQQMEGMARQGPRHVEDPEPVVIGQRRGDRAPVGDHPLHRRHRRLQFGGDPTDEVVLEGEAPESGNSNGGSNSGRRSRRRQQNELQSLLGGMAGQDLEEVWAY